MPQVHYHGGMIFVRTDSGTYADTLENFGLDYGAHAPPLPEGMTERIYEPGVRHPLIRDHDVINGGPMPWPEGDDIIASIDSLFAAQDGRYADAEAKFQSKAEARLRANPDEIPPPDKDAIQLFNDKNRAMSVRQHKRL